MFLFINKYFFLKQSFKSAIMFCLQDNLVARESDVDKTISLYLWLKFVINAYVFSHEQQIIEFKLRCKDFRVYIIVKKAHLILKKIVLRD